MHPTFFLPNVMKHAGIYCLSLLLIACGQSNSNKTEPTQELVRTDEYVDSVPLSYDELKSQVSDPSQTIDAGRAESIYNTIAGKAKSKSKDYSRLAMEDLFSAYERINKLSQIYVDSSAGYLEILESNLSGLEKRYEEIDSQTPIDINTKLKISETKSDIHQNLSKLRLKKIQ